MQEGRQEALRPARQEELTGSLGAGRLALAGGLVAVHNPLIPAQTG